MSTTAGAGLHSFLAVVRRDTPSGGELFQGNGSGGTQKRSKGEFSQYGAPTGEDAEKVVRGIRVRPTVCMVRIRAGARVSGRVHADVLPIRVLLDMRPGGSAEATHLCAADSGCAFLPANPPVLSPAPQLVSTRCDLLWLQMACKTTSGPDTCSLPGPAAALSAGVLCLAPIFGIRPR